MLTHFLKSIGSWITFEFGLLLVDFTVIGLVVSCIKNSRDPNWPLAAIVVSAVMAHLGRSAFERWAKLVIERQGLKP